MAQNESARDPSESSGFTAFLVRIVHKVLPPGGILASAFNMASCSIGAGILGLPGATDSAGMALAMIYLIIITFFSVYSMRILSITADKTHIETFEGFGRWLFPYGNYAFSYFAAFIRWFHSFAANVAYVISVGNCFKPIFDTAYAKNPDSSGLKFISSTTGNRLVTLLMWMCIMFPMTIPKHVDTLRYASACAITFMIYFVIIIVVHSCMNGLSENAKRVEAIGSADYNPDTDENAVFMFRTGNSVVNSVGVFVFAYVCQMNAMEVHSDMSPEVRNTWNYTMAATIGMVLSGMLYVLVCVFGYFDFGSKYLKGQSILLMYDPLNEPAILVAYVGVLFKLCVAYALLSLSARNSVYYMLGWQQKYATKAERRNMQQATSAAAKQPTADIDSGVPQKYITKVKQSEGSSEDVSGALSDEDEDEEATYIDGIPFWKHFIVVLVLGVAALLCGLFIPNINTVFGFAGAISGGFMAFVFPAFFFMYSGNWSLKTVGYWDYFLTYATLITGVVGIVWGTGGTIYNTI